jgi:hypothetical protein
MKKLALLALVPCALLAKGENPLSDLPQLAFNPVSAETANLLVGPAVKRVVQDHAEKWATEVEGKLTHNLELVNQSGVKLTTGDLARFAALVGVDCAYDGLGELSNGNLDDAVKASLNPENVLLNVESRLALAVLKAAWGKVNPFNFDFVNLEDHVGSTAGHVLNFARKAYVEEFLNNCLQHVISDVHAKVRSASSNN